MATKALAVRTIVTASSMPSTRCTTVHGAASQMTAGPVEAPVQAMDGGADPTVSRAMRQRYAGTRARSRGTAQSTSARTFDDSRRADG